MFSPWPISVSLVAFVAALAALLASGPAFTRTAEQLADRTGWGHALVGSFFLGAVTSLPGLVTSSMAAAVDRPSFAVSHALGGIAIQTTFIVAADIVHRKENLEYAAASLGNLFQSSVLVTLLGLVLLATASPDRTVFSIHPATPVMFLVYGFGLYMTRDARRAPRWRPNPAARVVGTGAQAEPGEQQNLLRVSVRFAGLALVVAAAGWTLAQSGLSLSDRTGMSDTLVGGILTSAASSFPEFMTSILAVRAGAATLAVANIIGGNAFDVLMVPICDVIYGGSVYHAVDPSTQFMAALAIVLASVLQVGLLRRERRGIGTEGIAIMVVYLTGTAVVAFGFD